MIRTMPTIGFNVEKVQHNNINLVLWDLGGQQNIRYRYILLLLITFLKVFIHLFHRFHFLSFY